MIITKLQGGLGNQLFQYAAGRTVSHKLGVLLKLDVEFYKKYGCKRQYSLNNFAIVTEIATADEIKKIKKENLLNQIKKIFGRRNENIIKENDLHKFEDMASTAKDNSYLEGFWASERYFKDIENIIRKEFTLTKTFSEKANSALKIINKTDSVSVHIRRGDYLAPRYRKIFNECPLEYYFEAVFLTSEKISNPHFFVFSDDIKWAKENLKILRPTTFVSQDGISDCEELILMSKCKNNIIANSTFSWWGAWLNENPEKIVIAPQKWFVDEKANENDLIPLKWIRL